MSDNGEKLTREWMERSGLTDPTGRSASGTGPGPTGGTDSADVGRRVREHWERRLKEALAMPEGDLRQEAVRAAEDALREWEQRATTGSNGTDWTNVTERVQ